MHCANTIFEIARSHYTRHDPSGEYDLRAEDEFYKGDHFNKVNYYQRLVNINF